MRSRGTDSLTSSPGEEEGLLRELFCGRRSIHSVSKDNDIIRRSRDSPAVFGELYDRHASVIYRYAARRAGDFAADDVTSEALSFLAWHAFRDTNVSRHNVVLCPRTLVVGAADFSDPN